MAREYGESSVDSFQVWVEETREFINSPCVPYIYIDHTESGTNVLPGKPEALYDIAALDLTELKQALEENSPWGIQLYASAIPLETNFPNQLREGVTTAIFDEDPLAEFIGDDETEDEDDGLKTLQEKVRSDHGKRIILAYGQNPSPLPAYEIRIGNGLMPVLMDQLRLDYQDLAYSAQIVEEKFGIPADRIITINMVTLKPGRLAGMVAKMQVDATLEHPIAEEARMAANIPEATWEEFELTEREDIVSSFIFSLPDEEQDQKIQEINERTTEIMESFAQKNFDKSWEEFESRHTEAVNRLHSNALMELRDLFISWGYGMLVYSEYVLDHDFKSPKEASTYFPDGGEVIEDSIRWFKYRDGDGTEYRPPAILTFSKIYLP